MTDNRAAQDAGAAIQLSARAKTIQRSLAESAPIKFAAKAAALGKPSVVRAEPAPADMSPEPAASVRSGPVGAASVPTPRETDGRPSKVLPLPPRRVPGRPTPAPGAIETPALRPSARPAATKSKNNFLKISALLAIALPTALAAIYYGFIAAPQYIAEAKFAVRGADESGATAGDPLGALTGMSSLTATSTDSYIVSQFIGSRRLVEDLDRTLDLRSIYTHENADFLAKYRPYDADDAIEHLTTYWTRVASISFDPITSIITFTVRAFTPPDALKIARETIRESEKLVNALSERAREDAIFNSKQELARAELRLKFTRKAIRDYRDREGSVDPAKSAESQLSIVATLESDLAKQEAELATAAAFLNKDAPTVRVMRNKAEALKKRIDAERAKIGSNLAANGSIANARPLLSSSIAEFEELTTERDFAEKAYNSALSAVETARIRAERQTRYLATFVDPRLPQDALYPARIQMVLLILVCSALAWAIGVLIFYGIRDHTA